MHPESQPPGYYIEHSERILKKCHGLPSALKVTDASGHGKKVDVWWSAIEKLEIIPHYKSSVQKILRISYDSLQDDHDRDLFLEIACFFSGQGGQGFDKCNYYTITVIENLIDICLLKIEGEKDRMHQSIQSMGRELICQQ
ncbi:disease resistance protein RPV1-like [Apium graveolens]|uniref:disease resistance protein RPV1-like n=1 Tax=Apium graveolens TaxID=4045 RepID=UPI003D7B40EE